MKSLIDGVFVEIVDGNLTEEEIKEYIFYLRNKNKGKVLNSVCITVDGDYVGLQYRFAPDDFVRIRRITGYITPDLKTWNNAKRAEERERVKHI